MGTPLKRRELFTGLFSGRANSTQESVVEKYTNKEIPLNLSRTSSGLAPYSGTFGEPEALHLLRRLTFGASKAHTDIIKVKTVSDAVDFLIDNPVQPTTTPVNSYEADYHDTLNCPAGASWVDFNVGFTNGNDDFGLYFFRNYFSFRPWWFKQIVTQPPHILEKITLFWSNHFGTKIPQAEYSRGLWQHFKTLRLNGLGNFKTLVKQITIDPHMLIFLNGTYSNKYSPDENYARELQELFTVGKGLGTAGYTEADVKAAARVLTGWRRVDNADGSYTGSFDPGVDWHDTNSKQFSAFYGNKTITGKSGAAGAGETDELLNMIFATEEVAKYICRKLYRWFVYYVIDAATEANVITPLANIFRTSNYDIKTVLKALFKSEHFFDPLNAGCIIKSPVDLYAGAVKEFNIKFPALPVELNYKAHRYFTDYCDDIGQRIGDPPNVSGWRAYYQEPIYYQDWITADTIQKRSRLLNDLSSGGTYLDGNTNIKIDSIAFNKQFYNPALPNDVIDNFIKYLLPKDLSATQKTLLKNFLLPNPSAPDYYWTSLWNSYVNTPDATNTDLVTKHLNSLINYITSLEEYQLC
jgi:hypothetical protein